MSAHKGNSHSPLGRVSCDLEEIKAIAREYDLPVIEDCAHALGADYREQRIGSYSDYCCFSLQAIKHISTGDGGILVCRDAKDHQRARSLRWFGIDREKRRENSYGIAEWDIIEAGYKFHMNDIAATIGLALFPHIDQIVAKRRKNAEFYKSGLADLKRLKLLREEPDRESSYWLFTVKVDDQKAFIKHLKAEGISSSIVHARNDRHSLFANYNSSELPGLDEFAERMVCIPVGPWVGQPECKHIVEVIRREKW